MTDLDLPVGATRTRDDDDFYGWALEQAGVLRSGHIETVDRVNLAEEIETLGRSEYSALERAIAVIIQHMLKWEFQPERRSRSWETSIREHRRRVTRNLKTNPSLKARLAEATGEAFEDGMDRAMGETNLGRDHVPVQCPYSWTEIMERPYVVEG